MKPGTFFVGKYRYTDVFSQFKRWYIKGPTNARRSCWKWITNIIDWYFPRPFQALGANRDYWYFVKLMRLFFAVNASKWRQSDDTKKAEKLCSKDNILLYRFSTVANGFNTIALQGLQATGKKNERLQRTRQWHTISTAKITTHRLHYR